MESNRAEYALWLVRNVADLLAYFWPITLGLLAVLAVGCAQAAYRRQPIESALIWLIPLATVPLLLILLGTLLERSAEGAGAFHPAVLAVWAVALVNIPVVGYLAYRARSNLALTTGAALLSLWITAAAWFPAVMSVTGDWL